MPDGEVMTTGNFHGEPLAFAADMLAVAELASISERRVDRMLDPAFSRGLPPFLAPDAGTNSGSMGWTGVRKLREVVANVRACLAVEICCASAGHDRRPAPGHLPGRRRRLPRLQLTGQIVTKSNPGPPRGSGPGHCVIGSVRRRSGLAQQVVQFRLDVDVAAFLPGRDDLISTPQERRHRLGGCLEVSLAKR